MEMYHRVYKNSFFDFQKAELLEQYDKSENENTCTRTIHEQYFILFLHDRMNYRKKCG